MCNRSQIWSSWLPPPQLQDPTWGGGGHPLAGSPASRTEHAERTAPRPARALNPSVHRAREAAPEGRPGASPELQRKIRDSDRPEGTLPSRSGNLQRALNFSAPALRRLSPLTTNSGSFISSEVREMIIEAEIVPEFNILGNLKKKKKKQYPIKACTPRGVKRIQPSGVRSEKTLFVVAREEKTRDPQGNYQQMHPRKLGTAMMPPVGCLGDIGQSSLGTWIVLNQDEGIFG